MQTFNLASGSHVLKWTYSKNASGMAGLDRGWVDQVRFVPDLPPCTYTISPGSWLHSAAAETGTVNVTTPSHCFWSVANTNPWVTITSSLTNTGSRMVTYSIAANPTGIARSGFITIAGQTFAITQNGVDCTFVISPTSRLHGPEAQTGSVSVNTPVGCPWSVSNSNTWVSIVSSLNNSNSGTVTYTIAANPTSVARSGFINIAGQAFAITQGVDCATAISPTGLAHGPGIETGSVAVATASGCNWSIFNPNSWVTILSSPNNSSGTVTYRVVPNLTASARSGFIIIAGQAFAVSQSAGEPPPPVDAGHVQVSAIGHTFLNPNRSLSPGPQMPCSVYDLLIDQNQNSGGGGALQSLSVNWDTNMQFVLTVAAPPGQKFLVHVPAEKAVAFGGFLWWESTSGGFSPGGSVAVSFDGLEGTVPDFSESTPTLSDSHGYFGFVDVASSAFTNDLAFNSITLTGTVVPQYTGFGELKFIPHHESRLSLFYTTDQTNDPGAFVSLVIDPSAPRIHVTAMSPDGSVALSVQGQAGHTTVVERSTDLLHWTPIRTNVSPFAITDLPGTNWPRRFYRTVAAP
jgi:hypothetical protein